MAALQTLHADQRFLSQYVIGAGCNQAADNLGFFPFLTNTTTAAADTNAGLQAAVTASVVHADQSYAKNGVNLSITLGNYSGELSDSRILALTTTTELVNLTWATPGQFGTVAPE